MLKIQMMNGKARRHSQEHTHAFKIKNEPLDRSPQLMGFLVGGHGGGQGALGLTHDSPEAWGSWDEAKETIETKNEQSGASHHLLAIDGWPRVLPGHEGGRERTEEHLERR